MGWPMNHLFPTSSLLKPNRLTIRLRFIDQVMFVLQPRPCQSCRICVERATSTPLFKVDPTFWRMLERPLMPESCRFMRRSLVAARYTSTEPEMRPPRPVNSRPTSSWVVRSHVRLSFGRLPGRYPTAGRSPNEYMVLVSDPSV